MDGIYRADLRTTIRVTYQHAWETPYDPYPDTNSMGAAMGYFLVYWEQNFRPRIPYDTAYLFTNKLTGDGIAGIAGGTGVACTGASYAAGTRAERLYPGLDRDLSRKTNAALVAHEIGYVLGRCLGHRLPA